MTTTTKRLITAVLAAVVAVTTLSGCEVSPEQQYLDATIGNYPDDYPPHDYFVDDLTEKQVLRMGQGVCDALASEKAEQEYAFAMVKKKVRDEYDRENWTWLAKQATTYLCAEHKGETIGWYHRRMVDAAGRAEGYVTAGDEEFGFDVWKWKRYGPDRVDHDERLIVTPVLKSMERDWFRQHRTMPSSENDYWNGLDYTEVENIGRMTDVHVVNGRKGPTTCHADGNEAAKAATRVENCVDRTEPVHAVDGSADLTMIGTVPAAGEPVGTKGITMVLRWDFEVWDFDNDGIANTYDDYDNIGPPQYSYSNGDDDFNVPGWICPTRFC